MDINDSSVLSKCFKHPKQVKGVVEKSFKVIHTYSVVGTNISYMLPKLFRASEQEHIFYLIKKEYFQFESEMYTVR